jgi:hypothetical protein
MGLLDEFWFPIDMALEDWCFAKRMDPGDSGPRAACLECESLGIITLRQPSCVPEIAS